MEEMQSFFATAPKAMEDLLAEELRTLGASNVKPTRAGASFEGNMETAYRVCLWSRLANRILMPIGKIKAENPDELYEEVNNLPWHEHMEYNGTLAVDFQSSNSKITHTRYGAQRVKDAIVDKFKIIYSDRPSVELNTPDIRVNVYLNRDEGFVCIDLSGDSLHKRGYREDGAMAPLKENLAAAILIKSGWPEIAKKRGGLVDPMCGSGTLPIEAALMAADSAPGLLRTYWGFSGWKKHQPEIWEKLIDEAEEREQKGLEEMPIIVGYDQDPYAIKSALGNLERIGLRGFVHFEKQELADCKPHAKLAEAKGLLVVNPPYGERLGDIKELKYLYGGLGEKLRSEFSGWEAAVITGNPDLGKSMGIRARHRSTLFNGALECKLLKFTVAEEFFVNKTHKLFSENPAAHVKRVKSDEAVQFANRLKKNLKKLKSWTKQKNISCYRAYDHDLPEYAVAVDIYDKWVHVQEYAAPSTIDEKKATSRLDDVMAVIPEVTDIPKENVFLKVRKKQKGTNQYEKLNDENYFHEVEEYGCKLLVNFSNYLDTGLFLDHRETRKMIQDMSAGKTFLNLFAYTGSATVHAAIGGAKKTTTVDMSRTYLDWAKKNMTLNGFGYDGNFFQQSDCIEWLKKEQRKYDLIFLDPPTFSNSKRMGKVFDVQKDHVELINLATNLLTRNGILIFSNNNRRFKMDFDALSKLKIEELTQKTVPKDFERNKKIHNCWKITKA